MSTRTLLVLALLVALLGVGLYVSVGHDVQQAARQDVRLFPGFDAARVTRIAAENVRRDWHLALDRDGRGGWRMRDPVELPADAPHVEHLLQCALAAAGPEVPAGERDPARLGFTPPAVVLEIEEELDGKRRSERVEIGELDADGQHVNVRVRGQCVRVLNNLATAIDRTLDDFKTQQVLAFVPGDVVRVRRSGSIVREGSTEPGSAEMELELAPDGWHAVKPVPVELDPTLVATWLQGLAALHHGGYIDELGAPPERFGLDPPELELVLELRDGSKQTLRVGRSGHTGKDWRAMRLELGCVWAVEQHDAWLVGFALEDLLDPRILRARREEISALTLHRAEDELYFTHVGKLWKVAQRRSGEKAFDKPVQADPAKVEDLLGLLDKIELDGFRLGETVEERPEFPAIWIQVGGTQQGGWIGPDAVRPGGVEGVLFQRRGENACSIAPSTLRSAVTRSIEEFWSLKLVDIPEQGQAGLRLSDGEHELVYVHNTRGRWTRRGNDAEAKELHAVLDALCFLRAERYLTPLTPDHAPWDQALTVEFADPLGNIQAIHIGRSRQAARPEEAVEVIFDGHRAVAHDQTLHAKLLELLRGG